jgi:hypothetical protein
MVAGAAAPPGAGEPDWADAEIVRATANKAVAVNVRFI